MALSKVVDDSIESVDAAKLSGTIADARFPATLPAISGANLTGIDALPAVGSSGNVLTSDGSAWASTAPAGGGAWTLIGSQVASNDASLTQTGLDSTYDTYAFVISDLEPATDVVKFYCRLGSSSGIVTSGYKYHMTYDQSNATTDYHYASDSAAFMILAQYTGSATGETMNGVFYLHNSSTGYPGVHGRYSGLNYYGRNVSGFVSAHLHSATTVDRIQIYMSSGNIATGRFTVYGIAHA